VIAAAEDSIPNALARVAPSRVARLRLVNGAYRMLATTLIANGAVIPLRLRRMTAAIAVAAHSTPTAIESNFVKSQTASRIRVTRATMTMATL